MESIGRQTGSVLPTEEQVRQRAYELYLARAGAPGSAESDWHQAQRELIAALSSKGNAQDGKAVTPAPARISAENGAKPRAAAPEPVVKATQPRRAGRGKASR